VDTLEAAFVAMFQNAWRFSKAKPPISGHPVADSPRFTSCLNLLRVFHDLNSIVDQRRAK
jgi:hypothetical protein